MPTMPEYTSFSNFLASNPQAGISAVSINGVVYRLRNAEPLHDDYKYQDAAGKWWSPDYFVIATAGQSNMVGGGDGGQQELNGNVQAFDPVTGKIVDSAYGPPFNVKEERNNLYLHMANELSDSLGRPVLVVTGAVAGSSMDMWLDSGSGALWHQLEDRIEDALALIGQGKVDSFLWLQGEGNYPTPLATYQAMMLELFAQVRGADWAGAAIALLVGELSHEGQNSAQNQTLQALEILLRNDPFLRFVSSTGLDTTALDGVHFTGEDLVEYGHRFFQAMDDILHGRAPVVQQAPVLHLAADAPTAITLYEGDSITLRADTFFQDPEGDRMWLYGAINKRPMYFLDNVEGDLVVHPRYNAAGTYTLSLFASDYNLDSARYNITLTVLEKAPGVEIFDSKFVRLYSGYHTVAEVMTEVDHSRGMVIHTQEAMGPGASTAISADNLTLRAEASILGHLVLTEDAARIRLTGSARLDVTGNARANSITGNDAANILTGLEDRDRLYGGLGNDQLYGGAAQDFLYGDDGNDLLFADVGDDRLYGGAGNDFLDSSIGRDQAYGGAGNDVFVFSSGQEQLVARDFGDGADRVRITGFAGVASFAALRDAAEFSEYHGSSVFGVQITLAGSRLQLQGLTLDDLYGGLFQFA